MSILLSLEVSRNRDNPVDWPPSIQQGDMMRATYPLRWALLDTEFSNVDSVPSIRHFAGKNPFR